ncbi:outer membrane lipoprotein carrier protein LolA [Sporosarcina thermotolerans]|uniref:Outer membrane lipoprotein carrier protein LolA n=1 Tax=Sporosarcina thermotolerans TaxID=633404 RepID=A0AAW9AG74_9BACL|nr:outer membrane lipoprotein carrier protein LolA [Sporosarcina thermotolerans]MDW0118061.1 outer membrane lipoprotein carrier protein LolA [Sporosarcina thermotolerans]WHT49117.1 outer membrane lipoprotein carrier protein LolA [Sporosarcina thermotolerans]
MRSRIFVLMLVAVMVLLAACGSPSKEDVMKKLGSKWNEAKGYELEATMEIKTGSEPRVYDVVVWHSKPDFYKVNVTQAGSTESQMIVRNEEGVFVITPSLGKTYKFQSDWPTQNSMPYLIGTLSDDINADKNATMEEKDKTYIFETASRNNHKKVLPVQQIHIDKKTLLPKFVSVMDENKDEKIRVTFKKITLGVEHKASDYHVDMEEIKSDKKPQSTENGQTGMKYYPNLDWNGTVLEEESVEVENGTRTFMTYGGGDKEFVVVQEPASPPNDLVAVSVEGDPVDLGFAIAALTENSIRWEQDGVAFFVASSTLTPDELITVASSMHPENSK